jgi:hypothetical protein
MRALCGSVGGFNQNRLPMYPAFCLPQERDIEQMKDLQSYSSATLRVSPA